MKYLFKNLDKLFFFIASLFTICVLAKVFYFQAFQSNFWYDESGQFWISLGLDHITEKFTAVASFSETVLYNQRINLDPGLFTFLLRYWILAFKGSSVSLHTLPFIFFVSFLLITTGLNFKNLKHNKFLSFISIGIIFLYQDLLYFAFELRAYGMEVLGISVLYYVLMLINKDRFRNLSFIKIFLIALGTFIFCGTRYDFFIYAAALVGVLLVQFLIKKNHFKQFFGFVSSLIIFTILYYFISLKHQSPGAEPPLYVKAILLRYADQHQVVQILKENFFSFKALPLTLSIMIFIFNFIFRKRILVFELFVFLATLGCAFLSIMGKMPWLIGMRWTLGLSALSFLELNRYFVFILNWSHDFAEKMGDSEFLKKTALAVGLFFLQLQALQAAKWISRYVNDSQYELYKYLIENHNEEKVLINVSAQPSTRYLFEYGDLKQYKEYYLRNVIFEKKETSNNQLFHEVENNGIRYVLLNNEEFLARFKEALQGNEPQKVENLPGPGLLLKLR
jgi:hypothetical protein